MNTRIYNVRILTMEEGKDIFQGEVWIQDDTITYAGPERKDGKVWDREIDGQGNLLMPGFKNAHTSIPSFLRWIVCSYGLKGTGSIAMSNLYGTYHRIRISATRRPSILFAMFR